MHYLQLIRYWQVLVQSLFQLLQTYQLAHDIVDDIVDCIHFQMIHSESLTCVGESLVHKQVGMTHQEFILEEQRFTQIVPRNHEQFDWFFREMLFEESHHILDFH